MIRNFISALTMGALGLPAATLEDFLNGAEVQEIRLIMHPSDWQRLHNNYLDNTYYPVVFEWRGMAVEEAGVRSRGSGSRDATKPGMRVDFNRYAADQEFLGLKSLVLDNLVQDQTMLKERLSLLMFQRMGLPAPRQAYTRLYVNGVYAGLYAAVEPVDKGFLRRNFGEDAGTLYDYEWGWDYRFEYLGDAVDAYSPVPFEPQTNEKNPGTERLVEMIRAINQVRDEEFYETISSYLDVKRFLTYLAAETFVAEQDGVAGGWGLNNFYLYRMQNGLYTFIPWDKDVTFHTIDRSIWLNLDGNVLTRRLLAVPEWRAFFLAELFRAVELAEGPGGWLEQQIEQGYQLTWLPVSEDPNKPFTYGQFEEGIAYLREFAYLRPWYVLWEITLAGEVE